jgi:hypothetical protein
MAEIRPESGHSRHGGIYPGVLVQIDWQTRLADMAVRRCRLYGAASTAFRTAGALRSLRNSLSRLNCPLWIRRNSSMPEIVIAAVLNHLNPSIGSMRINCTRAALDGYAASHRAVRELKADGSLPSDTKLRSSKYLNNLIEQYHRGVKQRIAVMLGFKGFRHKAVTIGGIELMHRIRKGQFGLGHLDSQGRTASVVWNAVLRA